MPSNCVPQNCCKSSHQPINCNQKAIHSCSYLKIFYISNPSFLVEELSLAPHRGMQSVQYPCATRSYKYTSFRLDSFQNNLRVHQRNYRRKIMKGFLSQFVIFETNMVHIIHMTWVVKKILKSLYVVL